MMEAEIASIPNGRYRGESTVYYDGKNADKRYQIRVQVIVEDRRITFDYSDTDPQSGAFVNGTFTSSASAAPPRMTSSRSSSGEGLGVSRRTVH